MITIRTERPVDERTREALLDLAYGPARHAKPSAQAARAAGCPPKGCRSSRWKKAA